MAVDTGYSSACVASVAAATRVAWVACVACGGTCACLIAIRVLLELHGMAYNADAACVAWQGVQRGMLDWRRVRGRYTARRHLAVINPEVKEILTHFLRKRAAGENASKKQTNSNVLNPFMPNSRRVQNDPKCVSPSTVGKHLAHQNCFAPF